MKDEIAKYLLENYSQEDKLSWDELVAVVWDEMSDSYIIEYNKAVALYNLADFIFTKDIKRLLKIMSDFISKSACRVQLQLNTIYRSVLILFGMCSSRPAYIYAAIFGSSSTRIFS